MVSRQPERYIPDVRDVFQRQSNGRGPNGSSQQQQQHSSDIRYVYRGDHSDEEQHYDYNGRTTKGSRGGGAAPPHQIRNYNNNHGNTENLVLGSTTRNNNYSKTLTEQDLKHIERHLSMKKTIRKQLSRHLSKAFVEAESEAMAQPPPATSTNSRTDRSQHFSNNPVNSSISGTNHGLTFNKTNVTKSESNFLDLLKEAGNATTIDGADSGHFSPATEVDRARLDQQWTPNRINSSSTNISPHTSSSRNNFSTSPSASNYDASDSKKSSFWKKLTIRSKSKR